jgi:hypothetical protein
MAGLQAPLSTLRVAPRGAPRMTRGQFGLLFLSCLRLSLVVLCRFLGALTCFIFRFVRGPLKVLQGLHQAAEGRRIKAGRHPDATSVAHPHFQRQAGRSPNAKAPVTFTAAKRTPASAWPSRTRCFFEPTPQRARGQAMLTAKLLTPRVPPSNSLTSRLTSSPVRRRRPAASACISMHPSPSRPCPCR